MGRCENRNLKILSEISNRILKQKVYFKQISYVNNMRAIAQRPSNGGGSRVDPRVRLLRNNN